MAHSRIKYETAEMLIKHCHIYGNIKQKLRSKEYFIFLLWKQKHSCKSKPCCDFYQISFTQRITFDQEHDYQTHVKSHPPHLGESLEVEFFHNATGISCSRTSTLSPPPFLYYYSITATEVFYLNHSNINSKTTGESFTVIHHNEMQIC